MGDPETWWGGVGGLVDLVSWFDVKEATGANVKVGCDKHPGRHDS